MNKVILVISILVVLFFGGFIVFSVLNNNSKENKNMLIFIKGKENYIENINEKYFFINRKVFSHSWKLIYKNPDF